MCLLAARLAVLAGSALSQLRGGAGPLGAHPLPRLLELAATKAAHFPAFDIQAASSGLRVGDEIVCVNGQHASSPLAAAAMLRDGSGDVVLSVRRSDGAAAAASRQPPTVPGLRMAHLPTASRGERDLGGLTDLEEQPDLGELTQRALRGIGGWFSPLV